MYPLVTCMYLCHYSLRQPPRLSKIFSAYDKGLIRIPECTVDSRYYDTAGIRKIYQYIQTIDISSTKFNCLLVIGILKRYHNKQYFDISDIVITRDHCITKLVLHACTDLLPRKIFNPQRPISQSNTGKQGYRENLFPQWFPR